MVYYAARRKPGTSQSKYRPRSVINKGNVAVKKIYRKNRRPTTKVGKNKSAIMTLSRQVNNLSLKQYGPVQHSYSKVDLHNHYITASSPWCFHVTTPGSDADAPHIFHNTLLAHGTPLAIFSRFVPKMNTVEGTNSNQLNAAIPNRNLFLKYVLLEFEFQGFVDDTHIQIDIVQSKGIGKSAYFKANVDVEEHMLPKCLNKFTNLAGFTQERIDRNAWRVLQTKRLYMNSRPQKPSSAAAIAGDALEEVFAPDSNYPLTQATTKAVKRCRMYIPYNALLRPLTDRLLEGNRLGGETEPLNSEIGSGQDRGPYNFTNLDPTKQIWCVISSSDQTALDASITGDAVSCKIHRTVCWRDPYGNLPQTTSIPNVNIQDTFDVAE